MTVYNPIVDQSPSPPSLQFNDHTNYVFGTYFKVSVACQINGVWWFCDVADGQYANTSADEHIGLYEVVGVGTANENYMAGSKTLAGTYSQGFNLIPFSSPIALSAGQEYMAVKEVQGHASGQAYCATSSAFQSGGPWGAGITDGPVTVYSSAIAPAGSALQEPNGNGQQVFHTWGSTPADVTMSPPDAGFNSTWYGLDIQIQTSGGGPTPPKLLMACFP